MPATRIHPRILQIAAPFEGNGLVNCYLIDAPKKAIIDTGTASVPRASLLPALQEIGWQASDVRVIINTHLHSDHAGGNADMLEASGAGIHMHRADAELTDRDQYLEKYCRDALRLMGQADQISESEAVQLQMLGREWGVERRLEEGDVIDLGDEVRLTVLHTPGHTPGSASFYWESERILFSGDAVNGRGGRSPGFPLYFDAADYLNSIKRLRDIPVETLAQAHRYRWSAPTQNAIRTGAEVRQTLEDSIAAWQTVDVAVKDELGRDPRIQFPELVHRVVHTCAPALGNDPDAEGIPPGAIPTIAAHMRTLPERP
ncbi:MAG: MBL fold metallo-hydrolase [Chloroflexi bacterium]|nr:MBL fold metallo-hydrolase [Chloroflexota bacterium]